MKPIKAIILVLQTIVKHFVTLGGSSTTPQCVLLTFARGVSHPYWGGRTPSTPLTNPALITCHPAEVTFPPLPQPKLVLD